MTDPNLITWSPVRCLSILFAVFDASRVLPDEALLAGRAVSNPERDLGAAAAAARRAVLLRAPAFRGPRREGGVEEADGEDEANEEEQRLLLETWCDAQLEARLERILPWLGR